MNKGEVPAEVRRFILTSVPSVPYLEAMLLLRAEPERAWDAAQMARRLYLPERPAGELLRALGEAGLAADTGDGRLRYAPSEDLRAVIDAVAHAYAADLVTITDLIHSRIDRRAQQFADAFRFRKD